MATASDAVQCLMLTVAILAAVSCIARPDYNFPLYLYFWWCFFYVPDDRKRQQKVMVLFMILSCIQDVIFLFYWPIRWLSAEWLAVTTAEEGVHIIATVLPLIQLIIKVFILALLLVPSLTADTPEIVKRWSSSSNSIIRIQMPQTNPAAAAAAAAAAANAAAAAAAAPNPPPPYAYSSAPVMRFGYAH